MFTRSYCRRICNSIGVATRLCAGLVVCAISISVPSFAFGQNPLPSSSNDASQAVSDNEQSEGSVPAEEGAALQPGATEEIQVIDGQDDEAQSTEEEVDKATKAQRQTLEYRTLAQDILVLDFYQLQILLRREGLSVQGDINEFRRRLFEYYDLSTEPLQQTEPDSVSNVQAFIESATEGGYFDIEEVNEQYVTLRGGVRMRLVDNEEQITHTIEAEELIFNQKQNLMTARGNVRYQIERTQSTEEFKGETLIFEIDDWQGLFFEGSGDTIATDDEGIDYRYEADLISRSSQGVVVMENALVTSSPARDPYYSLRTSKIWIIGPAEWALQDATLYVGEIPLFYFPYFFRPGDEIVFHPVFGAQSRNGTFIQTTTYLRGRKPRAEDRFAFLQTREAGNTERYLDGIFLRSSGEPLSSELLNSGDTLKLITDYYSRLGAYVALEGNFPSLGVINSLDFNVGLSYSRHLYPGAANIANQYTSFHAENGVAREFPVYSSLFGISIPLRYIIDTTFGIAIEQFSSSITFQLYSDRYITQDFSQRSEENDWYGIITGEEEIIQENVGSLVDSFVWRGTASYALSNLPAPFIASLSLDEIVFVVNWSNRQIGSSLLPSYVTAAHNSPQRSFFYPNTIVAPSLRVSLAGTLLNPAIVAGSATSTEQDSGEDAVSADARPPWEQASVDNPDETESEDQEEFSLRDPQLFSNASGYTPRIPIDYSLAYSLQPTLNVQLNTDNQQWAKPEDVDFAIRYSSLTSDNTLQLTYMIDLYQRYLTYNGTLSGQARYRSLIDTERLTSAELTSLRNNADAYNYFELSSNNTISSYFLQEFQPWSTTNFSYTIGLPLYRYRYLRDDDGTPVYETLEPKFEKDSITTHNINLQMALQALSAQQTLTLTYRLPPFDQQVSAALSVVLGPVQLTSNFSAQQTNEEWQFNLFSNNATVTIFNELSFSALTTTNLEERYLQTLQLILRTWFVSTTFTATHVRDVTFNKNFFSTNLPSPWEETGDRTLRPTSLSVVISERFEPEPLWKNRISYAIDLGSTLSWDFQRYTNSYFSLNFGLTFFLSEFLDLTLTSSIRNSQIYLYFDDLARGTGAAPQNFFEDILQSINVFDESQLLNGLFKLQNISLQATHRLVDWDLILAYTATPLLVTSGVSRRYEWDQRVSISIAWRAISELKRDIRIDREGTVTVE